MRTPTDMLCLRAGNRSLLLHLPSWRWLVLLAMALLALALLALSVGGGKLGLAGEQWIFLDKVFGEIMRQIFRRLYLPGKERPAALHQAAGGDVADEVR